VGTLTNHCSIPLTCFGNRLLLRVQGRKLLMLLPLQAPLWSLSSTPPPLSPAAIIPCNANGPLLPLFLPMPTAHFYCCGCCCRCHCPCSSLPSSLAMPTARFYCCGHCGRCHCPFPSLPSSFSMPMPLFHRYTFFSNHIQCITAIDIASLVPCGKFVSCCHYLFQRQQPLLSSHFFHSDHVECGLCC